MKVNHNKLWCATTPNYDKDKKWGNCKITSKDFYCLFQGIYKYSSTGVRDTSSKAFLVGEDQP